MTLSDIITSQYLGNGFICFVIFSGIIQLAPININPWTWLGKKIGAALNGEVIKKVDNLDTKLQEHIKCDEEKSVEDKRIRILRFADELQNHEEKSQSHYEQILHDITSYDLYCANHPEFKNNVTKHAAKLIEDKYDEHLRNDDFI